MRTKRYLAIAARRMHNAKGIYMRENIANAALLVFLAGVAYQDWKERQINVYILLGAALVGGVLQAGVQKDSMWDAMAGVCVGGVVLLLAWITRGSIGTGDGMMLMVSGIFLGLWRNISLLMTALGMIAAVALFMFAVKKKGRDYRLPFAPFLLAAYLVQLL